ncbi:hypothetical protein JCM10212_005341 [Sporobolomyces blumeae]
MSLSPDRSALVSSAVSFLRDPSTSTSPLAQRVAFLESKGLNPVEIQLALQSAAAPHHQGPPPREFERDWRDWFIMSVVGGGVGWLALKLAQKFLLPSLQPPSESDLEASQRALEAKYDEAALLLSTLQRSTDHVAHELDEQKRSVERELDEVRKAVDEMRDGERKRDEWATNVQRQVDDMAKSLPNLLERHSSTQASSLTDLQTELKSLKSLLIARRPPPPSSTTPSSNPSLSSPASSFSSSLPSTSYASSVGATTSGIARTPSLPAWQLKGSSAASLASSSSPSLSPSLSTPSSSSPSSSSSTSSNSTVVPSLSSSSSSSTAPASSSSNEPEQQQEQGRGSEDDPSASGVLVEKPTDRSPSSSSSTTTTETTETTETN